MELYDVILCSLSEQNYEEREAVQIARYLTEDLSKQAANGLPIPTVQEVKTRLDQGEPWQYISGYAHFYGMDFKVNSHVLIPRMETEELVFQALKYIPEDRPSTVLDVGTGSGIIALALAKFRPLARVKALDISHKALAIARENQRRLNIPNVEWNCLDFLDKNNWKDLGEFDIVVSNPPYIDETEKHHMSKSTIDYEPHMALFTRRDPMEFYISIAEYMGNHTNKVCGLVEINEFRGKETMLVFTQHGIKNVQVIQDLQGKDRIIYGTHQGVGL